MMLNVYDGAELPRVALDIYQLLLDGTLQFAQTILGAARPAVSDGAVQARYALRVVGMHGLCANERCFNAS